MEVLSIAVWGKPWLSKVEDAQHWGCVILSYLKHKLIRAQKILKCGCIKRKAFLFFFLFYTIHSWTPICSSIYFPICLFLCNHYNKSIHTIQNTVFILCWFTVTGRYNVSGATLNSVWCETAEDSDRWKLLKQIKPEENRVRDENFLCLVSYFCLEADRGLNMTSSQVRSLTRYTQNMQLCCHDNKTMSEICAL